MLIIPTTTTKAIICTSSSTVVLLSSNNDHTQENSKFDYLYRDKQITIVTIIIIMSPGMDRWIESVWTR